MRPSAVPCERKKSPGPCRGGRPGGVFIGQCLLGSGLSQRLWQEAQLPPQPSPFQPPCLEIQTTASAKAMISTIRVMIPRSVSIFCYLFSPAGCFCLQYTRFCAGEQREDKKKKCDFFQIGACNLAKAVL